MASDIEVCSLSYEGDLFKLKNIVAKNPESIFVKDSSQRTPLHWACSGGRNDVFLYLVDDIKVPVNDQDDAGWTPLMIAVSAGHEKLVLKLLEKKADVHVCNYTGQSVLHYAASKNHCNIAEILLRNNADPNVHDKTTGATPLHRAASRGHLKMVKLLKENKSFINSEDFQGNTPSHLACEEDRVAVVDFLLKSGANLDARNKDNLRPADLAPLPLQKHLLAVNP
eukprot:gene8928-9880_t